MVDRRVVPPESAQELFSERLIYLPHTYQANAMVYDVPLISSLSPPYTTFFYCPSSPTTCLSSPSPFIDFSFSPPPHPPTPHLISFSPPSPLPPFPPTHLLSLCQPLDVPPCVNRKDCSDRFQHLNRSSLPTTKARNNDDDEDAAANSTISTTTSNSSSTGHDTTINNDNNNDNNNSGNSNSKRNNNSSSSNTTADEFTSVLSRHQHSVLGYVKLCSFNANKKMEPIAFSVWANVLRGTSVSYPYHHITSHPIPSHPIPSHHITSHHITSQHNTEHYSHHNTLYCLTSYWINTLSQVYEYNSLCCIETLYHTTLARLMLFLLSSNPPYVILIAMPHLCSDISHSSGLTGTPRPNQRCPSQHPQSSQIPRHFSLPCTVCTHIAMERTFASSPGHL